MERERNPMNPLDWLLTLLLLYSLIRAALNGFFRMAFLPCPLNALTLSLRLPIL